MGNVFDKYTYCKHNLKHSFIAIAIVFTVLILNVSSVYAQAAGPATIPFITPPAVGGAPTTVAATAGLGTIAGAAPTAIAGPPAGPLGGAAAGVAANDFSLVADNIVTSITFLPGLLASLSYLVGLLLGILAVINIKDHVENPTKIPLRQAAIRLAVGGALFALPILYDAMFATIGTGVGVSTALLNPVALNLAP